MMNQFSSTQVSRDRLFSYVDNLILHGKTIEEAIDHASHQFGVMRFVVADLVREHRRKML